MAIVKTGDMYGQVGRLGQNVYYTAYSETRSRKLAASVSNPRTQAQMLQRVRWANLVNFYRVNRSWMKYAFETKKKNQSEYNKFMSLNVATSPIYLTKQEAGAGACVVYPYIITQGSLPSIEQANNGVSITTNLYITQGSIINSNTTVAELSQNLVTNNPALRYGDQLSLIRLYQQANPNTGTPFINLRKYELVLSDTNTTTIGNYWPMDIITQGTTGGNPCIAITADGRTGGVSFVLSRTIAGKTYVSTQRIVTAGMDNIIQSYSSSTQLQNAINSYGESAEAFLTSTYARRATENPVALNILRITWDEGQAEAGGYAKVDAGSDSLGELSIIFNGQVGTLEGLRGVLKLEDTSVVLDGGVSAGNSVTFQGVDFTAADHDRFIDYIEVIVNGTNYRVQFSRIIRNEDTIQGLE